jgi:hypothetical protein
MDTLQYIAMWFGLVVIAGLMLGLGGLLYIWALDQLMQALKLKVAFFKFLIAHSRKHWWSKP